MRVLLFELSSCNGILWLCIDVVGAVAVRLLLEESINARAADDHGRTALHFAASRGYVEMGTCTGRIPVWFIPHCSYLIDSVIADCTWS